jgi:hypothetical protein
MTISDAASHVIWRANIRSRLTVGTLRALDAAAHGVDVRADAATATLEAGTQLLDALRRLLEDP